MERIRDLPGSRTGRGRRTGKVMPDGGGNFIQGNRGRRKGGAGSEGW